MLCDGERLSKQNVMKVPNQQRGRNVLDDHAPAIARRLELYEVRERRSRRSHNVPGPRTRRVPTRVSSEPRAEAKVHILVAEEDLLVQEADVFERCRLPKRGGSGCGEDFNLFVD